MSRVDHLLLGKDLSISQARKAFASLFSKKRFNEPFAKALLVLLRKKGEHSNELTGLVQAVRGIEKPIASVSYADLVDGCGTGGDGADTFNISTVASLVAAGAGAHVAKHGNRSISSKCGSSDLLKAMNVRIDAPVGRMLQALRTCKIAYFHAPIYHKAFKIVQPIREELGQKSRPIRTIFNLVGPLVNPLRPRRQAIGVFDKNLMRVIAETLRRLNFERALVFRSHDGMDELSINDKTFVIELRRGRISGRSISPRKLGFRPGSKKDLEGGSPILNRKIALAVLMEKGKRAQRDVVLLNAAAILYVSGRAKNLRQGIALARKSLESGAALNTLKQLIRISHGS
ncbi:MAG: anthranilate phosphoribosyltransferase [Candidatus Omnitrophica bacterium]|nr:anthranilate phosphoribosyltransferase [Candidatus Omnitrophota bacterium]